MISEEVDIINKLGLHARASAKFVETANQFDSEVTLFKNDVPANGKSVMSIMMLAASQGTRLTLRANGADEAEALGALKSLISDRFGEGE